MARLPKLRINFDLDVQYLFRLKQSIEEDPKWSEEFRDILTKEIFKLITLIMSPRISDEIEKVSQQKAG